MYVIITKCMYLLPNVCNYYQMYVLITKCMYLLPNACNYYQMYVIITKCMYLLPNICTYYQINKRWKFGENEACGTHVIKQSNS